MMPFAGYNSTVLSLKDLCEGPGGYIKIGADWKSLVGRHLSQLTLSGPLFLY